MHNRALHDTLAAFVREAARQLADDVAQGAELPFELVESRGAANAPLYCWRPLTGRFVAERIGLLGRLPSYAAAAHGLAALPNLAGYLRARGRRVPGADARAQADAALQALLTVVWEDAGEFAFEEERFAVAYAELERVGYEGVSLAVVVTPVDGLVIESDTVPLGDGLALVRGSSVEDAPLDLRGDAYATVAALRLEDAASQGAGLESAGRRLRRLQTALRLWDDAEPALGPTAWARTGEGPWLAVPLATGLRRPQTDCLLAAEEEDPLRAFCALVARRTPRAGELAWSLRRFELGCERGSALEALTDWLLAARALLGPERALVRLAAICAAPAERAPLAARLEEAAGLERGVIAGVVRADPEVEALIEVLGGHLRAVLRDVLCGHLDPALREVADDLVAAETTPA
jgi:hypothetical protein